MLGNQDRVDECCTCMPYKDCALITAQALSIVAVCLSWLNIWAFLAALASFIMLQIVWCCKINKCGLIVAGVFGCISAVINMIVAILVLAWGSAGACEGVDDDDLCASATALATGVGFGAGILWITTSVLVFVFSCGRRYNNFHPETNSGVNVMKATAVPAEATVINQVKEEHEV